MAVSNESDHPKGGEVYEKGSNGWKKLVARTILYIERLMQKGEKIDEERFGNIEEAIVSRPDKQQENQEKKS